MRLRIQLWRGQAALRQDSGTLRDRSLGIKQSGTCCFDAGIGSVLDRLQFVTSLA